MSKPRQIRETVDLTNLVEPRGPATMIARQLTKLDQKYPGIVVEFAADDDWGALRLTITGAFERDETPKEIERRKAKAARKAAAQAKSRASALEIERKLYQKLHKKFGNG